MNFQDKLKQIGQNIITFIKKGFIQRFFRISYDVVWNIILFFLIVGLLGFFFIGGIGAGYFASLIKDEPLRPSEEMVGAIFNYEETSEIYFANNVFLGEVSSDLHRDVTTLDKVSKDIINGLIATEDEYFETHEGIVPKAILRAVFQEVSGSALQTGGSTLTQQIIKNQILTNEVSFDRKAKEIVLAMRLEKFMEKDEILEAYLNISPFGRNSNGRNIAGIQTAAQGIFGVDADEVNLAQAAFLAGLPQSPIAYSPFTNVGTVKSPEGLADGLSRMETVLSRMLSAGYINESQYQNALDFDLVGSLAERLPTTFDEYPYLSEEVRRRVESIFKEMLALEDGYTLEELESSPELNEQYQIYALRELSQGGYKIHTTINKEIYDKFQEVTANYSNYGRDKTAVVREGNETRTIMTEDPETEELIPLVQQQQAGAVLRDNATGAIIAFVAGRDFERDNVNFAVGTTRRQVGSTAKPILVYGPAYEEGVLQPGSILPDAKFVDNSGPDAWSPSNFSRGRYYGLVTARRAMVSSYNVSTAYGYIQLLQKANPIPDYLVKMGFDHIPENQYRLPAMALGSFEATVEENTSAFSTYGNNGQFVEGYMIEKIETIDGEVIYQHESKPVDVFSPQTSYLIIDVMRDAITSGTGGTARRNLKYPSVDWAGKTGTSNDLVDAWFVATNPNVTLGSWMGYGYRQSLDDGYSGRNQAYWAQLANAATDIDPELMAPAGRFQQPGGLVSRSFSLVSGLPPSEISRSLGLVGSDLFNANFVPSGEDYSVIKGNYVMVDGKAVIPGDQTPSEFVQGDGIIFNPEWLSNMGYDQFEDLNHLIPSNNAAWDGIEFPELKASDIVDTGKAPSAPQSLTKSGNTLSWNAPSSKNIVGYRIYRSPHPDDNEFNLVDSSTETELNVGNREAVYLIVAVDYFGRESEPSKVYIDGDFKEEEEVIDNSKGNEGNNNDKPDGNSGNNGNNGNNSGNDPGGSGNNNGNNNNEEPPNTDEDD